MLLADILRLRNAAEQEARMEAGDRLLNVVRRRAHEVYFVDDGSKQAKKKLKALEKAKSTRRQQKVVVKKKSKGWFGGLFGGGGSSKADEKEEAEAASKVCIGTVRGLCTATDSVTPPRHRPPLPALSGSGAGHSPDGG